MAETATTTNEGIETATTSQESTASQTSAGRSNATQETGKQVDEKSASIDKLIQSAVDRALNKVGNENKKLRSENEALKKAKLSDDEIRQLEMQEKEKELAERDKAITDRENRLIAIKAIKEAGLDDGSDASLAIIDFVMADDEDGIRERVKAFNALVERIVKTKVDGVFKASGRTPGVGSDTASATSGKNESIAARMGRNTAATNQKSRSILDQYIGGK